MADVAGDKPRRGKASVSLLQAEGLIGKSRQTLAKWIETEGCPCEQRADRERGIEWRVHLPDVVAWMCERSARKALEKREPSGDGGEPADGVTIEEAKRRRAVAEAVLAELRLDQEMGEVVAVADVVDAVTAEYAAVRSQLKPIGAKIAPALLGCPSAPEIKAKIDAAIQEALEELKHDDRLAGQVRAGEGVAGNGAPEGAE